MTSLSGGELDARRRHFHRLYDAHHDDLWRYCLRRANSNEAAEEALSETFAVAWRRLDIVPSGDDARPWLFGVARNELRSGWRKHRRGDELRDRLIHARHGAHVPDPAEAATDRSNAIIAAMSSLREKDQEILRLTAWEELPHAQIAEIVGCSENAVAIRIHRARDRLAKALAKLEITPNNTSNRETVKAPDISAHVVVDGPTTTTRREA